MLTLMTTSSTATSASNSVGKLLIRNYNHGHVDDPRSKRLPSVGDMRLNTYTNENSMNYTPKQSQEPILRNDLDKIMEPEGEEMTRPENNSRTQLEAIESKTKEAMIETNIREDTPNIMVSNENSVESK